MCSRPKENPAYSYEPEPMEPDDKPETMELDGKPETMERDGKPEPMGGRPERGGRPEQDGKPERGDKPERDDKPELAGDKPAARACRVQPGPLPQQGSTTRLKLKTRNYLHA
jgi:hypothetical protein